MIDKKKLNDAMKGKKTPTQPTDPNMTLEVQNPEVEELMKNYAQEKTPEHLNQLIEKLRLSRMLVPANLNDKKQPVPSSRFPRNRRARLSSICRFSFSISWLQSRRIRRRAL